MNERDSLMKQIMAFSFAAYDWNLYLDTHPCDKFAIKMFQSMTEKANSLKNEYIEKYKNIDPITDALYDACDLSQHIFDAANAVNDLINYPVETRERVVKADIERSLLDPWRDLPTSGGDVDPDTGEIKED